MVRNNNGAVIRHTRLGIGLLNIVGIVRQSLTHLKRPQSHKSSSQVRDPSRKVARGNLSFKFSIDTSKQSEQFQGVPAFSEAK